MIFIFVPFCYKATDINKVPGRNPTACSFPPKASLGTMTATIYTLRLCVLRVPAQRWQLGALCVAAISGQLLQGRFALRSHAKSVRETDDPWINRGKESGEFNGVGLPEEVRSTEPAFFSPFAPSSAAVPHWWGDSEWMDWKLAAVKLDSLHWHSETWNLAG